MKPMIWRPEEQDIKVNQYLDRTNHAPYELLILLLLGVLCGLAVFILVGVF